MAYCLTCFGVKCLQSSQAESTNQVLTLSTHDKKSFPQSSAIDNSILVGRDNFDLQRSLTKNANQSVKSSPSTPLLFDTELAASHYPRASQ